MKPFVPYDSVLREIWGKSDTVLFIFAGAAAEFALNKAVDWLYFTGKLPKDPIGRLFSTVRYAREIIYADEDAALATIDKISHIHHAVEKGRGGKIPEWAYRDVLYMLIYYSIAAFELLEKKLSAEEKESVYDVFLRMGKRMNISDIPDRYTAWLLSREEHLLKDLYRSDHTNDLFRQYRRQLGRFRYFILIEAQKLVVPMQVAELLEFSKIKPARPLLGFYKLSRRIGMDRFFKQILLPSKYMAEIKALDLFIR